MDAKIYEERTCPDCGNIWNIISQAEFINLNLI